jgi:hypothetical protein
VKVLKAIAAIEAAPERKFAAALLGSGLVDAQAGDVEAREWVERCAPNWVSIVTPVGADPSSIHRRLLDAAGMGAAP